MGWPVMRGVITLGHAMTLGFRALKFSANVALDELQPAAVPGEPEKKKLEISGWIAAVNIVFSVGFFIFMYKFLPLLATTELKRVNPVFGEQIVFNLVDGIIRLALFLLFIWGTSLLKDIRRVYEYHGAEHKTVFAFENGDSLNTPAVQKYSTYHPRCGTSFLMTVMIISIFVYMLVPVTTFWARFAVRIVLLPVITGLSYEIIRFAAKHRGSLFALMTAPGLWMQRIPLSLRRMSRRSARSWHWITRCRSRSSVVASWSSPRTKTSRRSFVLGRWPKSARNRWPPTIHSGYSSHTTCQKKQ
jgi:uncharacterized protein YqhQ